jgi:hypothetical protein
MTTNAQAEKMPARICGNSTCQNACQGVAPQLRAASVCSGMIAAHGDQDDDEDIGQRVDDEADHGRGEAEFEPRPDPAPTRRVRDFAEHPVQRLEIHKHRRRENVGWDKQRQQHQREQPELYW